jgi:GNAT superfamily N-acetyltransferase
MDMITYQVEHFTNIYEEMKPLNAAHFEEIASFKDQFPLNPNYDQYLALDKAGVCHTVTCRNAGELIGYYISFVMPHMHYRDCIFAINDIVFIAKEYRGGSVGKRLIQFALNELTKMGVHRVCLHVKTSNDFGVLLERMGFSCTEKNYEKLLNRRV